MTTETKIRSQILRRIQRIPSDRLNELNEFVSKLEQTSGNKAKILSFAGAWENIDPSAFAELTENILSNREKNTRRHDQGAN